MLTLSEIHSPADFLFANSPAGARALANLYALVETAKTNGIEPWSYFKKIFTALPLVTTVEPVEALLPWKVSKVNYPVFKGALTVILWVGCRVVPISRWLDEGARQSNDSH